ncbi:RES family NAD+ phosphorylase [Roseomonas populi]|uniref:RES domain-containing protein n=1 Tax=Roseomonas populi TaxID=3121582 RepID=A0ABT1X363_9PROT|nr:RES domain-containing protein [Roseomonas pecuniae]MCR0982543.1 RES domain-containing protein [Roseomonas pecuniae]
MIALPPHLGGTEFIAWRLDQARYAEGWDSGEGAYRGGGRWNSPGRRVVYASLDAATAILEVAVHKGFDTLDLLPHVLTSLVIPDPSGIFVVQPSEIPDPAWLHPRYSDPAQTAFGDSVLDQHPLVLIPSAVSTASWNLLIAPDRAAGRYTRRSQAPFSLDPRLVPPSPPAPDVAAPRPARRRPRPRGPSASR